MLLPVPLAGSGRYQQVGDNLTPEWAVYQFGAFTHPVSQFDHACGRFGLCRPGAFGWPLGIRKIMAVGAPMQARAKAAVRIAYQFGQFEPGMLEVCFTAKRYFPSEVNRVHQILSVCIVSGIYKGPFLPIAFAWSVYVSYRPETDVRQFNGSHCGSCLTASAIVCRIWTKATAWVTSSLPWGTEAKTSAISGSESWAIYSRAPASVHNDLGKF